ncbi:NAD-dependent succinate-semialdehyde dehydrogenase [Saccharopolyspora shandongensis]|uniref:NAD-dependent succinate-semialdehyde dehydrogenase n=1 Tax=Saccharopolyspora shandongensis TaxID=418495 RepID=UPI0033E370D2
MVPHRELWIGGEWHSTTKATPVMNPSTGEVLADVASCSAAEMLDAVAAASHALPAWGRTSARERAEVLRKGYELMMDRADDIATVMCLEMGKTPAEARAEVAYAAEFFRWLSELAAHEGGEFRTSPSGRILTTKRPVGVCLLVTPWNFPAAMATRKIGPALAAGCTVILKPAAETPLTALLLADLLHQAGVPRGVVNVVPTDDPGTVVAAALSDPRVRKLSFTGSTSVGRLLLKQAAEHVTRTSMELGGNAPFLVLADADVDDAIEGALLAKMRNGGQACTAANRFLVNRSLADEFTDKLRTRLSALRIGAADQSDTELGPMVSDRAVTSIKRMVSGAESHGASAERMDSGPDVGYFHPATALTHVAPDSPILQQEIFAPAAPIVVVDDDEHAVALANDTDAGLAAYVYGSLPTALGVAERLEVGMVGINRGLVSDPAAPFGGVKHSGLGREGGHEGIAEYQEISYVSATW